MKRLSIVLLSLTLLGGAPVKGMLPESTAGKVALAAGVGLGLYGAYRWCRGGLRVAEPIVPVAGAGAVVEADVAGGAEPAVDLGEQLIAAASHGNQTEVARLIAAHADVNHASADGNTALMMAGRVDCGELVRQLLAVPGININHACHYGRTTLMWASVRGLVEIVEILLAAHADIRHVNIHGYTALMEAAQWGQSEIVRRLLSAGSDLNHVNHYGWTALTVAAQRNHGASVLALLRAGSNVPDALTSDNAETRALLDLGRRARAGDAAARTEIERLDDEQIAVEADRGWVQEGHIKGV